MILCCRSDMYSRISLHWWLVVFFLFFFFFFFNFLLLGFVFFFFFFFLSFNFQLWNERLPVDKTSKPTLVIQHLIVIPRTHESNTKGTNTNFFFSRSHLLETCSQNWPHISHPSDELPSSQNKPVPVEGQENGDKVTWRAATTNFFLEEDELIARACYWKNKEHGLWTFWITQRFLYFFSSSTLLLPECIAHARNTQLVGRGLFGPMHP